MTPARIFVHSPNRRASARFAVVSDEIKDSMVTF
jgi:hypothetical protein